MSSLLSLTAFDRLPPPYRARMVEGLPLAIDAVAESGPATHAFLRHGWFAAAVEAYGGRPSTLLVEEEGEPLIALPLTALGPVWLGLATVPGCYWPFRSFAARDAASAAWDRLVRELEQAARALRIGPVAEGDPSVTPLLAAARRRGWRVLGRTLGQSWRLDFAAVEAGGGWPRGSTLRKNRFHDKHLAAHGALDWRRLSGSDWPGGFEKLAAVEEASWIASRTDGRDAKFTRGGHGAFWRAAARDEGLANLMEAALLEIDGRPAAFSFDLAAGLTRYAVANSYDPRFAKHSPGKLLQYRNLVRAREAGTAMVDWGSGDPGYKQILGAEPGPMLRDWLLLRPGAPAWLGGFVRRRWERQPAA